MIKVERLTYDDYVWSVEVAASRMILEEVKRPELLNKVSLYKLVDKIIDDGSGFVAKEDGVPVGAIAGLLLPNIFNEERTTLAEIIWYVLPNYRNTRAGAALLKAFTQYGEEVADETTLSLLKDSPISVTALEKRGFKFEEFALRR